MGAFTQDNRLINITTPLPKDALLLSGVTGFEAVSQMFHFTLDMAAENTEKVDFDKLLGQPATVEILLHNGGSRYINGIISKLTRTFRGTTFTGYVAELVPKLWLLTKNRQSRIFQHKNVPDILKDVLEAHGIEKAFELPGTYEPRDYCVQYRETDFAFVSRLMEEEGIFYFFKHAKDGHKMVLANSAQSHPDMPHMANLIYEGDTGGWRPEERVQDWVKMQQMRSGKVTLWDNCFELPYKHLECTELIQETVQVGKVTHKLKVGGNDQLEVYDYPGGYAQRFDGISKSGGEQSGDLQKIFTDNQRTTKIRMEQEAMSSLLTFAASNYANLVPGHKFNLQRHFQDDAAYIVTEIHHSITQGGNYRSSAKEAEGDFKCSNQFTCIPAAVKFRPPLLTPRPAMPGTQTAVVVGPAGEEIFTDKYGRVKVQFPWDRHGKGDADSSCWVRVAVPWAGKTFGFVSIPRIGQEVVVAFEEGDLDRPIIIGCVYNADNMPPHKLPDEKTQSGIKSRSSKDAGSDNLNEIRFEDKKGSEHIFIHGEKDMEVRVKKDAKQWYGQDTHCTVVRDNFVDVQRDYGATIGKDMKVEVKTDHHMKVGGKETIDVGGGQSLNVTGNMNYKCSGNLCIEVGGTVSIKGANVILEASTAACISGGSGFSVYNAGGVQISGPMVSINSGGSKMPGTPASCVPVTAPNKPVEPIKPGTTAKSAPVYSPISPGAAAAAPRSSPPAPSQAPTHNPNAAENKENKYWIEIVLCDEAGQPCPGEYYEVKLPDGETVATGTLDDKGFARVDHIKDAGNCQITFPKLDKDAWEPK